MVDSCSRENGALCTVARSWLLFLHDKSERKNCDSNIAWGVDGSHQTFWSFGSFVASCDIVFDWYAMLRGVFIEQRFFYERWLSFTFGGLVLLLDRVFRCQKFEQLQVCWKIDFVSSLAVERNCLAVSRVIMRTLDEWKYFRCLEKVILCGS